jgi:antitoxin YefM
MKTTYIRTTISEAQAHLDEFCDAVVCNRKVVIIKRPIGADVALVAADELSGLIETLYLLRSPRNARRLFTALKRVRCR